MIVEHYINVTLDDGTVKQIKNFQGAEIFRNLNDIIGSMSFSMPLDIAASAYIVKFRYLEYYVKTDEDGAEFRCKFRGYVDSIHKSISKQDRRLAINCLDKLSLFDRITFVYPISTNQLRQLIIDLTEQAKLIVPDFVNFDMRIGGLDIVLRDIEPEQNLVQYFRSIREKTVLYIYYDAESDQVVITTPTFLQLQARTSGEVETYSFDTETNMLETFDYGDITNDINAVVYVGAGGQKGMAIDFFNLGTTGQIKPIFKYNFSTTGKEELEDFARNDLFDIIQNYKISFSSALINTALTIEPGSIITVNDHNTLDGNQFFIVREIEYDINKTSNAKVALVCSATIITDFPENIVLQRYGILDPDTLTVNEKPTGDILLE